MMDEKEMVELESIMERWQGNMWEIKKDIKSLIQALRAERAALERAVNYMDKMNISIVQNECYRIAFEHDFHEDDEWMLANPKIKPILILSWLAKIDSEVGEAVEAVRNDDMNNLAEELADIVIRVFDTATCLDICMETAIKKKMEINRNRPAKHGKKC
jgi:NTP pyrophosphatase (non-canonical NTP hydrolase)